MRIKNRHFEDFSEACRHDFIEIKWRIFVSPGIVIPVHHGKSRIAIACEKTRPVVAAPWLVGGNRQNMIRSMGNPLRT